MFSQYKAQIFFRMTNRTEQIEMRITRHYPGIIRKRAWAIQVKIRKTGIKINKLFHVALKEIEPNEKQVYKNGIWKLHSTNKPDCFSIS